MIATDHEQASTSRVARSTQLALLVQQWLIEAFQAIIGFIGLVRCLVPLWRPDSTSSLRFSRYVSADKSLAPHQANYLSSTRPPTQTRTLQSALQLFGHRLMVPIIWLVMSSETRWVARGTKARRISPMAAVSNDQPQRSVCHRIVPEQIVQPWAQPTMRTTA